LVCFLVAWVMLPKVLHGSIERFDSLFSDSKKCHPLDFAFVETTLSTAL